MSMVPMISTTSSKIRKISRRKFVAGVLGASFFSVLADAVLVEPTWPVVRRLRIGRTPVRHRFVHFSDIHHKGDGHYLKSVVSKINGLEPDFVCFTGDLVEHAEFLPETLSILSGLNSPMFGVPGNHDYLSGIPFEPVTECFAATRGAWLTNEAREVADGQINLIGITCHQDWRMHPSPKPRAKNILLLHYPARAKRLGDEKFDLMLAGHSHGGQVRLPVFGPLFLPSGVDQYDLGLFQTKSGPLYVNAGIGYLNNFDFRFNCRPEITLVEL